MQPQYVQQPEVAQPVQQQDVVQNQAVVPPNYAGGINPGGDPKSMSADQATPHPLLDIWNRSTKLRWGVSLSAFWFIAGHISQKFVIPVVISVWQFIAGGG